MDSRSSNKTTVITVIVVLILGGIGYYWYTKHTVQKISEAEVQEVVKTPEQQNEEKPVASSNALTELNGKPLSIYTNQELKFSFMYPSELGTTAKVRFDTNQERVGEYVEGSIVKQDGTYASDLKYAISFGASSPAYNPGVGRGVGLSDMIRKMDFISNDYQTVTELQGNGVKGILLEGTTKCVDMCNLSNGAKAAVFPIPENKWGIAVMGIYSHMPKEDFVKLMSTFTVLE